MTESTPSEVSQEAFEMEGTDESRSSSPQAESYDLPTLEVSGTASEMGQQYGEAFREKIRAFVDVRFNAMRGYFAERGRPNDWEHVHGVGASSRQIYAGWDPAGNEELSGIAVGSGIAIDRLFTAVNMTDMRDAVLLSAESGEPLSKLPEEGCSSILLPREHTGGAPLAAQTWDLNASDLDYVVALRRRPKSGPETWGVTCTGCLTLMGINEFGVSVGTTNIKTYGSRPGVGYISILHRAVRAESVEEAEAIVREAPHAGAHTYWLADSSRQVEVEASPNGQFTREATSAPIFRTNHCIAEAHVELQGEVVGESSTARFARLEELSSAVGEVDDLKLLFADRSDGVHSINRYPEDNQGTATNAVFIADPENKRAHACRGPADRGEWVELSFD